MRLVVLGLVAACSSPAASTDAGQGSIAYDLYVIPSPGTRTHLPQVFVDGIETTHVQQTYPDLIRAQDFAHTVELRYAGNLLERYPLATGTTDCTSHVDGPLASVKVDLEALDSGEIRFYADDIRTTNGGCLGDGFGIAPCYCPGERCIPRVTLADPLFTKMACAPIGPKAAGDPCTPIDDPDGAYDDCGENLTCYQATCHTLCYRAGCATTCVQPEGYPPEGALCM